MMTTMFTTQGSGRVRIPMRCKPNKCVDWQVRGRSSSLWGRCLASKPNLSYSSRCSAWVAPVTVHTLVGAAWMDTLGTVQKHSMQEMA